MKGKQKIDLLHTAHIMLRPISEVYIEIYFLNSREMHKIRFIGLNLFVFVQSFIANYTKSSCNYF